MGKYETPDYTVIHREDMLEIRTYAEFYIVEYDNDSDPEIDKGFGTLFSYLSKDNKEKEQLSMTVPVIEEINPNKKKMAFVIPAAFKTRIPEPNNHNLKIKKFEKGTFAVIRYSGNSNKEKEKAMQEKLTKWIQEKHYSIQSPFMLALYNPPFIPPMFKRNEMMVRIG